MSLGLDSLTFDCADARRVATFWAAALGFELDPDSNEQEAYLRDPTGATEGIFLQKVPEPKIAKNRVHLDLRPSSSMAEEVDRLTALGATSLGRVDVEGSFWTVMQDPEGNELCVLRGPEDGWKPDAAGDDEIPG